MRRLDGAEPFSFSADAWLSDTLGKPVFKLAEGGEEPSQAQLEAQMEQLAAGRAAFFYAKVPTRQVGKATTLVRSGFAVVDTAITFAWRGSARDRPAAVTVTPAQPDQHGAVASIAGSAFRWSRFHLDPRISDEAANLVKRRWIENYLSGKRGAALYVAQADGAVAGFLAVLESQSHDRSAAIIDLIAVAPGLQGRGIGGALVDAFVAEWRGKVDELRVGTQAANIQSLRFYENAGFRIAETSFVLHAHTDEGRDAS
jgi:ribosomal protein S18 acetylase RimI-like enzyme